MPNWCDNTVEIYHKDPAMLERVRKGFKEGKLLNEFLPVPQDLQIVAGRVAEELDTQLDLPMMTMFAEQSKFFKHHYRSNWHNRGIMVREIDVIRSQEGW